MEALPAVKPPAVVCIGEGYAAEQSVVEADTLKAPVAEGQHAVQACNHGGDWFAGRQVAVPPCTHA